MWIHRARPRRPDEGGEAGGAEGGAPSPAPAPAPSPAPTPAPSPAPAPSPSPAPAPAPASNDGKSGDGKSAEGAWRADWREELAGGDEKTLKQLQRYASPADVWKKAKSLEERVSAGELRAALPKNATADQLTEWRKANGIPDKPEGYDIGATAKMNDETKALLDKALPVAHALNLTPDQAKGVMKFLNDNALEVKATRAQADDQAKEAGEEALRAEWGAEFKRNVGLIHNTLAAATSPEFKDKILNARDENGSPLSSDPGWLNFLLHLSLIENPAAKLVPNGGANPTKALEERIAEIEAMMGSKAYINDDKMQAEYRDLVDARDKLKARA